MKVMDAVEHALRSLDNWRGWKYPDTSPGIRLRPWHPDGDVRYRPGRDQFKLVHNSDAIIEHVKNSGTLRIGTGDTRPENQQGKVGGIYLNVASEKDPQFTVSREPGPRNLWSKLGYSGPYGKKVRIGKNFIAQGYPMNAYSDHKMHIYDPIDRTITEIQWIEEPERNPVLVILTGLASLLAGLFGKPPVNGGYHCHGVQQYSLDVPSTDPSVKGSTAANIPNVGMDLRYDDLMNGWRQMTGMAIPQAKKNEPGKPGYVWPATNSDGPSTDPNAMKMGQVLKLRPEVADDLLRRHTHPLCVALVECWRDYGIILLDTGGNISWGMEPDNRIDQTAVKPFVSEITLDMFRVYELEQYY